MSLTETPRDESSRALAACCTNQVAVLEHQISRLLDLLRVRRRGGLKERPECRSLSAIALVPVT